MELIAGPTFESPGRTSDFQYQAGPVLKNLAFWTTFNAVIRLFAHRNDIAF